MAQESLSHLGRDYSLQLTALWGADGRRSGAANVAKGSALSVSSLPVETLSTLPCKTLVTLYRWEVKVLKGESKWEDLSKEFVSTRFRFILFRYPRRLC